MCIFILNFSFIYIYIYKLSLYKYDTNIMHTTYLLVCCTDYKMRGLAHEAPPFMHLKNIACIRFMPLVNRLLWAAVCTWHTYYTHKYRRTQMHSNTHAHKPLSGDDLFFTRSKFFFVSHAAPYYVKCIMALCNLLWLMIRLNFFIVHCRLDHHNDRGQGTKPLSFDPRTWLANCSTIRKRYIPLRTIINLRVENFHRALFETREKKILIKLYKISISICKKN